MVRYPHILSVSWLDGTGTYDATGDYQKPITQDKELEGRAEINGQGTLVALADGSTVVYTFQFYSGPIDYVIPYNAEAELLDLDRKSFWKGTIKGFMKNQRSTRIWL